MSLRSAAARGQGLGIPWPLLGCPCRLRGRIKISESRGCLGVPAVYDGGGISLVVRCLGTCDRRCFSCRACPWFVPELRWLVVCCSARGTFLAITQDGEVCWFFPGAVVCLCLPPYGEECTFVCCSCHYLPGPFTSGCLETTSTSHSYMAVKGPSAGCLHLVHTQRV